MNFFQKYSWILGFIILAYGLYIYLNNKTELFSNKSEAYGVVYDVTSIRLVGYTGLLYKYRFKNKGKVFFGKTTKNYSGNFEKDIYYKVKFITGNPKNNEITFENKFIQKIKLDKNGKILDTVYVLEN
ncbi:hypothetical protein BW723_04525 [Polaribacter reichenbachii]|uniref:DUF3592 domain-containing protein n=1 Tax=Polaribacter reichenbachii TaxID=996801 RepID=A0A1B8TUQ2_9FLAO|nr:hypothetical protein [Polaribacter reichenbachii]APZ45605.1 hypothetical protein BW723_04525 [Polaribacter reichenbachii]AUC19467.1 hypothetical protein BTO17_12530 [Polaribacter reichenbachii]OBY63377.1 hypothetical protein LPB301_11185 [Polaribacter reichenbachii]